MDVRTDFGDAHPQSADTLFDAYAATYSDTVNRSIAFLPLKIDYFTRVKASYLLELLEQHFDMPNSVHLLDIGCGIGNSHNLLVDNVASLTGTDVSLSSLAQAAERNPQCVYQPYDGTSLPWSDGQFDAVFTTCVMHHVPPAGWETFVAEMTRVVRRDGLVIVFEHNPLNPLTRRAVANCEFDNDAVLLAQDTTCGLLSAAGLRNVRSRSILTIPSFGPLTRKLDLMLGSLSLGAQYFACGTA